MRLCNVPRGVSRSRNPRAFLVSGTWPHGQLADHYGAHVAQALAARLAAAIEAKGWTIAELSRRSGVARPTIDNVLAGEVWCDLLTIANLEHALDVDLWPGRNP